ncbi:two-component system chemotaxis sensor kinase CheA [Silvibacterium bohemicum]|uniref:Chemotaxis protein CheA n=1 Tax=Silvibacterium bohemicum TaxID=1577686 RepID=A0A841K901_9BACT|nr:chemotaxis protein CheA [Silvibacterium bohemicum]MBB6147028.1 two-component system chemotaxis sensor kinase CheA [Silvibacterium bohemicum]
MSQQSNTLIASSTQDKWKACIDELASRLMVEGSDADVAPELRSIAQEAAEQGASSCAETANKLLAALDADRESGTAYLLKDGIAMLRASIDAAGAQTSKSSSAPSSFGEDEELVGDFLVEAREHLSTIEGQLLALERSPSDMEAIHAVFRAFHTIKGLAGFLDFQVIREVAHEVETILDLARNEKLVIESTVIDVVLESGDFLQTELSSVEQSLQSGNPLAIGNHHPLVAKIRSLAAPPATEAAPPPPKKAAKPKATKKQASVETVSQPSEERPEETVVAEPIAAEPIAMPEPSAPVAAKVAAVEPPPAAAPAAASAPRSAPPAKEQGRGADTNSVRVETAKLDHLMDVVGEIVVAQSLIRHNPVLALAADSRLLGDLSQLARVTAEVQRATMSMRMIPVGQLFQRVERVIRDLSRKAGKLVVLETSGVDTEIDKTVAEELADPLLHMVRNSVDHGIEMQADRIAAGKSAEARIRLSAHHQSGQILIEISDDGRGLDSAKIRRKAEERQLISPNAQLTDTEIYQLIFEPGFSTAEKITDVSGRGVGMDVVRRNVEKLRGRIETQSTKGLGTTFQLKLPLTLAIIDGLVVEVGINRYIIPLSGVRETFRPRPDSLFTVEGRDEMVLVREELMPVVRLYERLGIEPRTTQPSEGLLVVLESENKRFCLLIDELRGKQEVVIKSLGEVFKDAPGFSGCAVLGDGHVGLILDIDGIYRGRRR